MKKYFVGGQFLLVGFFLSTFSPGKKKQKGKFKDPATAGRSAGLDPSCEFCEDVHE
ncbi:MAG: hypothetical protein ACJ75B_11285 [Flavisolibacter sp.]